MIGVQKTEIPEVLEQNAEQWTREYLESLESGTGATNKTARFRYRHPDIKSALRSESFDKCIYCESKLSHTFPGETEHIAPVSICPELIVEWENLAYVCTECNRRKGSYHSVEEPLINPYVDEPSEHLRFYGPIVFQVPGDTKGYRTQQLLELSRMGLVEKRIEKLEFLQKMIDIWSVQPPGPTRNLIEKEILAQAERDQEYAATSRAFIFQTAGLTATTA